jgi:hypothetical protein
MALAIGPLITLYDAASPRYPTISSWETKQADIGMVDSGYKVGNLPSYFVRFSTAHLLNLHLKSHLGNFHRHGGS